MLAAVFTVQSFVFNWCGGISGSVERINVSEDMSVSKSNLVLKKNPSPFYVNVYNYLSFKIKSGFIFL